MGNQSETVGQRVRLWGEKRNYGELERDYGGKVVLWGNGVRLWGRVRLWGEKWDYGAME